MLGVVAVLVVGVAIAFAARAGALDGTAGEVAGVVALVGAMLGIAALGIRWSVGTYALLRAMVQASDAAMRDVAAALDLTFVPGSVYEHPTMGAIPEFGQARGDHRGFTVSLAVPRPGEDELVFHTEITLYAPAGAAFAEGAGGALPSGARAKRLSFEAGRIVLVPETTRRGSSQSHTYFVITDAAALQALVKDLCALGQSRLRPGGGRRDP